VQTGDNDSGRFFAVTPVGSFLTVEQLRQYDNLSWQFASGTPVERYFDENNLDHAAFISAGSAFFNLDDTGDLTSFINKAPFERSLVSCMLRNKTIDYPSTDSSINATSYLHSMISLPPLEHKACKVFEFPDLHVTLSHDLHRAAYPEFGLYIFTSDTLFLSLMCGGIGQSGNGGHAHNDKLSIELNVQGKDILRDPGTYVYTPLPDMRNTLRSVNVHATINAGTEQSEWIKGRHGLFHLLSEVEYDIPHFTSDTITAIVRFKDIVQMRTIRIHERSIEIEDASNKPFTVQWDNFMLFSPGYGKLIKAGVHAAQH
jgi:hypothetical protein